MTLTLYFPGVPALLTSSSKTLVNGCSPSPGPEGSKPDAAPRRLGPRHDQKLQRPDVRDDPVPIWKAVAASSSCVGGVFSLICRAIGRLGAARAYRAALGHEKERARRN